jgi:hypothetical protein
VKAPPKLWQRLYEAVNASNLANTDSESVPPAMELVLLHGAFERALDADSNYNDFVLQLGGVLQPKQRVTCRTRGAIQPKPKRNETFVLEAWARDFCVSRGSVAHGRHYAAAKPTWSLRNHLLLATYLLPLVLKRVLAKSGMTRMTEFDVAQINMFERLACFDHFGQQSALTTPAWRRLMSDVELRMNARRIGRHLRASGRLAKKGNVKLPKDNG